ncbi:hypothetical protein BC628DRAFT_146770 [Trametes gibbosa]|nr:hypothetical protein BC628DRAFT_146770 [Trametes gibbosa]
MGGRRRRRHTTRTGAWRASPARRPKADHPFPSRDPRAVQAALRPFADISMGHCGTSTTCSCHGMAKFASDALVSGATQLHALPVLESICVRHFKEVSRSVMHARLAAIRYRLSHNTQNTSLYVWFTTRKKMREWGGCGCVGGGDEAASKSFV